MKNRGLFPKTVEWSSGLLAIALMFLALACSPKIVSIPEPEAAGKIEPSAVKAPWQMEWESLVKEAKKEQWLVILSGSSGETRLALTKAMIDKFDIKVDWLTARPPEVQAKILAEQRAGITSADVIISGSTTGYALKQYNLVEPLDKMLIIPEVIDPSKWHEGKFPWWDKEHMIITSLTNITPIVAINTQTVEEKDVTSFRDLLNPRWKGRISMTSPLIGGTGLASFGMVGEYIMGWDYLKELARQDPVIVTDTRLGVEWLARGKQDIAWAARSESMAEFQKAGAPVKYLKMSEGTYATDAGQGFVKLKEAPHKAASAVFINWLLTREGQRIFSESRGFESNRTDVPKDFIDPIRTRQPGVKYMVQDEKARALENSWLQKAREILGHLMR